MTSQSAISPLPVAAPHHDDAGRLFAALLRRAATPSCPAQTVARPGDVEHALKHFLETLRAGARRPVRVSARGAGDVSADELGLGNLIAAIQIGREDEARLRADWLVRRAFRDRLFAAAAKLADRLADEWIYLPLPTAVPAPKGRRPMVAATPDSHAPRHAQRA